MARRFVDLLIVAALAASVVAFAACNIEDSGNTYAADSGGGGEENTSADPATVPGDQLAVSGAVYEEETQLPIMGALVTSEPPIGAIRTNAQGQYVFTAAEFPDLQPEKLYRLTATRSGYLQGQQQILIKPGHNRNVDIPMVKAADEFNLNVSVTNVQFADSDFRSGSMKAFADVELSLKGAVADTVDFQMVVSSDSRDWLSADPASGQVASTPVVVAITADKTGLEQGTYTGTIRVQAPGGSASIQVTLMVGAVEAPPDGNTDEPAPPDGNTDQPPA